MIKFTIPYPPTKKGKSIFCKRFGLNAYYAGKHWSARKRDAEELHWMTRSAMRRAGIRQRMLQRPVEITFRWDDRLDIDNHAVLGKAIVDGMKGYILQDDNRRYVRRVCHEFWDGGEIQVEVRE
jgi:hypothetical protein